MARLAAAYAEGGDLPVTVFSLRPRDGGDELRDLLERFDVDVHVVDGPEPARARMRRMPEDSIVVLDTPAVRPQEERAVAALADELKKMLYEIHLTLPATVSTASARELVADLAPLGISRICLTHLDETSHIGGAVEVAIRGGKPFSYVGSGTGVAEGWSPPNPMRSPRWCCREPRGASSSASGASRTGQRVKVMIGDLPAIEARVEEITEEHAIVGLLRSRAAAERSGRSRGSSRPPACAGSPGWSGRSPSTAARATRRGSTSTRARGHPAPPVRPHRHDHAGGRQPRGRADRAGPDAEPLRRRPPASGPADLQMDERVKLDIEVGEDEPTVHARGRVVRDTREGKGVRIEMIEEGDRERLIHFVFERQRTEARVRT